MAIIQESLNTKHVFLREHSYSNNLDNADPSSVCQHTYGHSYRSLIEAIFTLPYVRKNLFRGIVANDDLLFFKDSIYSTNHRYEL
jgi:hypothetical protein